MRGLGQSEQRQRQHYIQSILYSGFVHFFPGAAETRGRRLVLGSLSRGGPVSEKSSINVIIGRQYPRPKRDGTMPSLRMPKVFLQLQLKRFLLKLVSSSLVLLAVDVHSFFQRMQCHD